MGNFDTFIGVPNMWEDSLERQIAFEKGVILLIIFSITTIILLISILRTIITPSGGIPEDKEWDM